MPTAEKHHEHDHDLATHDLKSDSLITTVSPQITNLPVAVVVDHLSEYRLPLANSQT